MEVLVVTTTEAARMLRLDNSKVMSKLNSGEIPAFREGCNWKIPISLLNAYVENRAIREAKERKMLHESELKEST